MPLVLVIRAVVAMIVAPTRCLRRDRPQLIFIRFKQSPDYRRDHEYHH